MLASAEEAIGITESITTDKKMAEYYILNYKTELKKYEEARQEYLNFKEDHNNISDSKSNMIGNPTEQAALKSLAFNDTYEPYHWLKAVEIVQRGLDERKNIFIKVRREAERNNSHTIGRGRKGWVAFTQRRYAEEIERQFIEPEMWIAENTIKSWWQDILNQAILIKNKFQL